MGVAEGRGRWVQQASDVYWRAYTRSIPVSNELSWMGRQGGSGQGSKPVGLIN